MLDDTKEFDRDLGINKGLDYAHGKDSLIGIDRGISTGMKYGVKRAENENRDYTFVSLSKDKTVLQAVDSLRDIKDAEEFVDKQISDNKERFEQTGFIHETSFSTAFGENDFAFGLNSQTKKNRNKIK